MAAAKREGADESAALWLASGAFREALFGNAVEARKLAGDALALSPGRDVRVGTALTLATVGDAAQAQKIAEPLNAESPFDTIIQNYWLPSIRATLALHHGDARQAVSLLEAATPYEMGLENFSVMAPIYIRGMAYLKAGQGAAAAAQFKNMLGHRGVGQNDPVMAMAQLQLARAQAMSGDKSAARRSYQDFLSTWKQADAEFLSPPAEPGPNARDRPRRPTVWCIGRRHRSIDLQCASPGPPAGRRHGSPSAFVG
jgi:eukaryotic-like serine/threonine-protein kinase